MVEKATVDLCSLRAPILRRPTVGIGALHLTPVLESHVYITSSLVVTPELLIVRIAAVNRAQGQLSLPFKSQTHLSQTHLSDKVGV